MVVLSLFRLNKLALVAVLAALVVGCAKPTEPSIEYDAADRAKEKQQSLLALKKCFFSNYLALEDIAQPASQIASQIRSGCEFEFRHLRAVKLNYAPVPDIHTPPQRTRDEEVELAKLYVVQKRELFSSQYEFEQFKQFHPPVSGDLPIFKGI